MKFLKTTLAANYPDWLSPRRRLTRVYQKNKQTKEAVALLEIETQLNTTADERESFFIQQIATGEVLMVNNSAKFEGISAG